MRDSGHQVAELGFRLGSSSEILRPRKMNLYASAHELVSVVRVLILGLWD